MKRILAAFGFVFLVLGIAGAWDPLWPSIMYVMCAFYLFAKSSSRLYDWLHDGFVLARDGLNEWLDNRGKESRKVINAVFIVLGLVSFVMGAIGIVMPLWPTTPYWLLSAYLFSKSSKRLHDRLFGLPKVGKVMDDYMNYGAITVRAKVIAFVVLLAPLSASFFYFHADSLYVRRIIVVVLVGVSTHVFMLGTMPAVGEQEEAV